MKTRQPLGWAMFALVAIVVVGLVVMLAAAPATAGGYGPFETDREFYRPGQTVTISHEYVPKASRDWRGPYRITLVRGDTQPIGVPDAGRVRDRYVGDLRVERWSDEFVRVSLTFTMPALPDGSYGMQVCNPGCGEALGVWGEVFVGYAPPKWQEPPPVPTLTFAPTTTFLPTTTVIVTPAPAVVTGGRSERDHAGPSIAEWVILVGFGAAIVAWAFFGNGELLARRRRRRTPAAPEVPEGRRQPVESSGPGDGAPAEIELVRFPE